MNEIRCRTFQEYLIALTDQVGRHGMASFSWYVSFKTREFGFESVDGRWILGLNTVRGHYAYDEPQDKTLPGGIFVRSCIPPNDVIQRQYRADVLRAVREGRARYERLN